MSDGRTAFETRLQRLVRRHQALARGHSPKMRPDGLIVREPRRIRFRLPLRGFVLLMAMLMVFKGLMLAASGHAAHAERLVILWGGSLHEKAAALVMGIDPVSRTIADFLASWI